ncbi:MAG: radical SAM protein [Syntrophaceae bacterium]
MKEKFFRFLSYLVAVLVLRKPDLADLIYIKYHSFNAYWQMGVSYFAWRLGLKKSFHIVSIVIEPTNRCTLRCEVCPTKEDMTRKKGFMDFELYKKIIDENSNVEFINLFLWGEPLLHPRIIDMIQYAKEKSIEVTFYSNGTLLDQEMSRRILETGVDRVTVSLDGVDEMYEKSRNYPYEKVERNILGLLELRNEMHVRTAIDVSMVISEETECGVEAFEKRWTSVADTVRMQRHNTYEKKERSKSCFELWRGNVLVHWDGTVVPCFIDYDATVKLGDANKQTLREIYNGKEFQQIRAMHAKGNFPEICHFCTEYESKIVSSRVV